MSCNEGKQHSKKRNTVRSTRKKEKTKLHKQDHNIWFDSEQYCHCYKNIKARIITECLNREGRMLISNLRNVKSSPIIAETKGTAKMIVF